MKMASRVPMWGQKESDPSKKATLFAMTFFPSLKRSNCHHHRQIIIIISIIIISSNYHHYLIIIIIIITIFLNTRTATQRSFSCSISSARIARQQQPAIRFFCLFFGHKVFVSKTKTTLIQIQVWRVFRALLFLNNDNDISRSDWWSMISSLEGCPMGACVRFLMDEAMLS